MEFYDSHKKPCESFCLKPSFNCKKKLYNCWDAPCKFYNRIMYIAPTSGH